MAQLNNVRFNNRQQVLVPVSIREIHTVYYDEKIDDYVIQLKEQPLRPDGTINFEITVKGSINQVLNRREWEEGLILDVDDYYPVFQNTDRYGVGLVYFNANKLNTTVYVDYQGVGSILSEEALKALPMNDISSYNLLEDGRYQPISVLSAIDGRPDNYPWFASTDTPIMRGAVYSACIYYEPLNNSTLSGGTFTVDNNYPSNISNINEYQNIVRTQITEFINTSRYWDSIDQKTRDLATWLMNNIAGVRQSRKIYDNVTFSVYSVKIEPMKIVGISSYIPKITVFFKRD